MFKSISLLLVFVATFVVLGSAQNKDKVRVLDKTVADRYLQLVVGQNAMTPSPTTMAPATAIEVIGSGYTGITTYGYNTMELPDGTVMIGTKGTFAGPEETLSAVQFGGTFPAGGFRYPMDNNRKSDWTTLPDTIIYRLYTFFPNGVVSTTTAYKPLAKYWSGQIGPPKFVLGGSSSTMNGTLTLSLSVTLPNDAAVSVIIRDADTDYNMTAIPASAIKRKGNQISINATAAGYQSGPNADIVVVIAASNGLSDQALLRGPVEPVVVPVAQ